MGFVLQKMFKVLFKWLFTVLFPRENEPKEGQSPFQQADVPGFNKSLNHLGEALDHVDTRLDQQLEARYGQAGANTSAGREEWELNVLRAEVAELRADVRLLKRTLHLNNTNSEAHDAAPYE